MPEENEKEYGIIKNKFRILLAERASKLEKNIAINHVKEETGIAWSTLQAWANNKVTRYDEAVIVKLLEYFNCDLGDLMYYVKPEGKE